MAQTQAQWTAKLQSFVPAWWFDSNPRATALFNAMGAVFAGIDADVNDHFLATFITQAVSPTLNAHGEERGVFQLPNESAVAYRIRIQRITSQTDKPHIKKLIDSLLLIGQCTIYESPTNNPYFSRGNFIGQNGFFVSARQNYFLVTVPQQVHAPYSFFARSNFAARSNFIGSIDSTSTIFQSIIAAIDRNIAFGVMYGILEI